MEYIVSQLVQFKCCASLVKDYKQDRLPFVISFSCTVIDLENLDLEKVSWQQRVWLRAAESLASSRELSTYSKASMLKGGGRELAARLQGG